MQTIKFIAPQQITPRRLWRQPLLHQLSFLYTLTKLFEFRILLYATWIYLFGSNALYESVKLN